MPKETFDTLTRSATLSSRCRELKARKDKVIDNVLEEINKLPNDPKTGVLFRGSMLKVIKEYQALNHWLSRDMITSKRKRQKKAAEAIAEEEAKKQPAENKKAKTTTPPPIDELSPVPYSGRKKGTTHLAKKVRDFKFAQMKNTIVRGWANKEIRPNSTLKEWILRNQQTFGFHPEKAEDRVTVEMVKTRIKRGQLETNGIRGQRSFLEKIEPRLVSMVKLSSACNQELTEEEILQFVNSYIRGSVVEQDIIDWKLRNVADWRNNFLTSMV